MAFTLLNALINLLNSGNIGIDHQRIVGVIYDKSRFSAGRFFDMFFLNVVNLYFFISSVLRVVGRKFSSFLKSPVWQLLAIGFHDDMRSRTAFCVEPPVVSNSEMESQFVVLQIIFSNIHMITIAGNIVEWFACNLYFIF